jgi:hypothetical protein
MQPAFDYAGGPITERLAPAQSFRLAEFGGRGMSFNICRGTLGSLAMFTARRNASSRGAISSGDFSGVYRRDILVWIGKGSDVDPRAEVKRHCTSVCGGFTQHALAANLPSARGVPMPPPGNGFHFWTRPTEREPKSRTPRFPAPLCSRGRIL